MRALPLYLGPDVPLDRGGTALPVQLVQGLDVDPGCARCGLCKGARNPCIPADGEPGGVLVVGERPGRTEDATNRPLVGEVGNYLRAKVREYLGPGAPVVYDNAVRCFTPTVEPKHLVACRPYLAKVIEEARPRRILALGPAAWESITGRSGSAVTMRRAYAWLGRTPVFYLVHPQAARRNRFVGQWFEEDLRWALTFSHRMLWYPATSVYGVVQTAEDAESAERALSRDRWVAVDAETSGVEYEPGFRVVSVACAGADGGTYVWGPRQLRDEATLRPLRRLLWTAPIVGSNLKSDLSFLRELAPITAVHGDVRLWRKLDDPEASGGLENMAELVGMGGHKAEMQRDVAAALDRMRRLVRGAGVQDSLFDAASSTVAAYEPPDLVEQLRAGVDPIKFAYGMVPEELLLRYNARDAQATAWLAHELEPRLGKRDGLRHVWDRVVHPMTSAISRIESWGVPASAHALSLFDAHLRARMTLVEQKLAAYGSDFNPGSTKQVADLLFGRLGLKPPPDTETATGKQRVDEEVLGMLAEESEVVAAILEYRSVAKLRGTYCDGIRKEIRSDGRVHPSILPDGARSGRCSCVEPNLQNIPRADDSAEGKMARDVFAALPGWVFLHIDFRQLEYRIAAMLSQDPEMIAVIKSGKDFHTGTAELIAPVMGWTKIEKPQRSQAKTLNFALLYRMAIRTLAQRLGITLAAAEKLHGAVLGRYRKFAQWSDQAVRSAKTTGYCRTWWAGQPARWRPLYRIADQDGETRSKAEHGAVNSPVQGTAADFCNASLPMIVDWILDNGVPAELCLPIHDAVLIHVREDALQETASEVKRIMESHESMGVPIEVDVESGPSWGSLTKLKLK